MDEKRRVLIVDDESIIRRAMADYLADCGYETVTAGDGAEGLAKAQSEKFDIVLVDLRMPRMDGLEVISTLKNAQPELPIVVVSGTGVLTDAIEAMRQGAWDYLTKPIQDIEEIRVTVERVIERAQLLAERDRYQCELEDLNRSLEVEVARQTRDLRMQNRELAALNSVSYAISDPLDLDTMLGRAIAAAVDAVQADGGVVRLLNPAINQLVVAAALGFSESYLASAQAIQLGQGIIGQVAQSGRPYAGANFADDDWLSSLRNEGFLSFICVPLRAGDSAAEKHPIVGTLGAMTRTERDFSAHDVDLLTTIGNQIGVAVARAQYASDLRTTNIQLEQANVELRQLDELREQFIQNVAHELRTPLALVRGYVEMLAQGGLAPEEQRVALEVTSRRVETLVELVEAITTLQDLGAARPMRVETVSPAELTKTACQMTMQRAATAGIDLRCDCAEDTRSIPGDFTRLSQALHQLLDNACKFSPEDTVVTVAVWVDSDEGVMCISVTDQGIGIPPEEHERIFERFYQVDGGLTRRYGGTGLGLALVKEVVEAHRGRITVESEVGEGSTFTMYLPLKRRD
ncbi:MAG: ATP-binding protein [Anaerolineae bacterium]|jgi:signal transduction histidine kinase/DNA-binding response OmpR family regulator